MGKYKELNNQLISLVEQGKTGKEISKLLKINYTTVHRKLRKLNINLPNYHNKLKFDNTMFDSIDTEEKAYWLGFLYADGSVSSSVNTVELSLKGEDSNHLIKFKRFLKSSAKVRLSEIKVNGKTFTRCRFQVTDKHFHDRLMELGCIPRKSLILRFPNEDIFSDISLVYAFIRGYLDGDGSVSFTHSGRLRLEILGTAEFLTKVQQYLPQFGNRLIKDKRRKLNTYSIVCSANKADEVAKLLYKDANIYLERKYNRLAVLCRNT